LVLLSKIRDSINKKAILPLRPVKENMASYPTDEDEDEYVSITEQELRKLCPRVVDDSDWKIYRAMNYCEGDQKKHTVTNITTNFDLTELVKIDNMGHGVLVVNIPPIPENDIAKISATLRCIKTDPSLFPDYNHPDIELEKLADTCIGMGDCFVGIFSCGSGDHDRFALVVKSYSIRASLKFQTLILNGLETSRSKIHEDKGDFVTYCETPINGPAFLGDDVYRKTMEISRTHRLRVARYIFTHCDIKLPSRYCGDMGDADIPIPSIFGRNSSHHKYADPPKKLPVGPMDIKIPLEELPITELLGYGLTLLPTTQSGEDIDGEMPNCERSSHLYKLGVRKYISIVSRECNDYPVVFISQRGNSHSLLLFNHVYEPTALHCGAPYFTDPGHGFFTYKTDSEKFRSIPHNIHHVGAPLGVPFSRDFAGENLSNEMDHIMSMKLFWNSQLSIYYLAHPDYYGKTDQCMQKLETAFELGERSYFWRTWVIVFSPIDESKIGLDEICDFAANDVINIPMDLWDGLFQRYMAVYREWKTRIYTRGMADVSQDLFPPSRYRISDVHPVYNTIIQFAKFPSFSSLFSNHPPVVKVHAAYRTSKKVETRFDKEELSTPYPEQVDYNRAMKCPTLSTGTDEEDESNSMSHRSQFDVREKPQSHIFTSKDFLSVEKVHLEYLFDLFYFFRNVSPNYYSAEYRTKQKFVDMPTDSEYSSAGEGSASEKPVTRKGNTPIIVPSNKPMNTPTFLSLATPFKKRKQVNEKSELSPRTCESMSDDDDTGRGLNLTSVEDELDDNCLGGSGNSDEE
jgi:hypothetical protein